MNSAELRATVIGWLDEIKTWGPETKQKWGDYFYTDEEWLEYKWIGKHNIPNDVIPQSDHFHLVLWTNNHEFHIAFFPSHESPNIWILMPFADTRKPRAGESWTRGNDLSDGEFSRELFFNTMLKIVAWELVAKVKFVKPKEDLTEG